MENKWTPDLTPHFPPFSIFPHQCCGRGDSGNRLIDLVNEAAKQLEEEMYKLTGYEINATETGVEIEIVIPGVKKEDVSVKFQKDSYIVSYIDRDGEEEVVAIHLGQIDDEAIANLDTDFEKNGHDITIALGILTIKVPYRSEETEELTIKEVV